MIKHTREFPTISTMTSMECTVATTTPDDPGMMKGVNHVSYATCVKKT